MAWRYLTPSAMPGAFLGMGDIVALVEQVTAGVDMEAAPEAGGQGQSGSGS